MTTCRTQASAQTALTRQQVALDHLPAPQSPSVSSVTTYVTGLWRGPREKNVGGRLRGGWPLRRGAQSRPRTGLRGAREHPAR